MVDRISVMPKVTADSPIDDQIFSRFDSHRQLNQNNSLLAYSKENNEMISQKLANSTILETEKATVVIN
jgi:hypothetical protein